MTTKIKPSKTLALLLLMASCQSEPAHKPAPVKQIVPGQSAPTSNATGPLSETSVTELLEAQAKNIRACFIEEAKWVLSVSLRVEPSGQVSQANVFDLMQGSQAATCVEETLRKVRFPSFAGDAQRVSYSYTLRPMIEPAEVSSVPVPVSKSQPTPWSVPADASVALLEAEKFFALGDFDAAEKSLAPFQDKLLPEMIYLLGGIAAKRGQVGKMCEYDKRYIEVSPQSPAVPGLKKQIEGACSKPQ